VYDQSGRLIKFPLPLSVFVQQFLTYYGNAYCRCFQEVKPLSLTALPPSVIAKPTARIVYLQVDMLTVFKPVAEKALTPLARLLRHVNPNALTMLGLVFPVIFFVLVAHKQYAWALVALVLTAADMLDGLVARSQNKVTAFGGLLDSTVDRFADFVVIVAFSFTGIVSWNIAAPFLLFTYLISYIRSRTELAAKGNLVASVGFLERTERLTAIFIGLLCYAIWPDLSWHGLNIMAMNFIILIALSAITVGQRIWFAYKNL
jgi:archaetidylinositol phosphate synthase